MNNIRSQITEFVESLPAGERAEVLTTLLKRERSRTKSEAIMNASLLATQLRVLGLSDAATEVTGIMTQISAYNP